ncbi:MAG: hypothetical protein FGF48_09030 [Candidatus Brockarchaeota archaeon]|nr:hypothetical protein [Candidatus Brockarchaeota archaeon]
MGNWYTHTYFNKKVPEKVRRSIRDELHERGVVFFDEDPGLLRHKLRYLPMILRTAMYAWANVRSLETMIRRVKKIGVEDPSRNHEFYFFGFDPFKLGEEKARELCTKWIREDEEYFDKLIAKLPVKLKLVTAWGEGGVRRQLAWPTCTLKVEEVTEEIDFLSSKPFLAMDNDYDKWIVEYGGYWEGKEKGPEKINSRAKLCGKNFKTIVDVYKKHGVEFWFTFVWV